MPGHGRAVEPGLPAPIAGGGVALPVYEHDRSLRVWRVERSGRIAVVDEIADGGAIPVIAGDLSSKLRVAAIPVTGAPRWRAAAAGWVVAGVRDGVVIVADFSARDRERATRTSALLAAYADARIGTAEFDQADAAPLAAGCAVLGLDPVTGRVLWREPVPGTEGPAWRLETGPLAAAFPPRTADARRLGAAAAIVRADRCYLRGPGVLRVADLGAD